MIYIIIAWGLIPMWLRHLVATLTVPWWLNWVNKFPIGPLVTQIIFNNTQETKGEFLFFSQHAWVSCEGFTEAWHDGFNHDKHEGK